MVFPVIAAAAGLVELAPILGRWLSGDDAERVAHRAVGAARRVSGVDDVIGVVQHLRAHPDALMQFQKEMATLSMECELSYLKDRQSARDRDVAFVTSGRMNYRADIMVVCAGLGMVMCLGSLAYFSDYLPGEAVGIISTIAGIFGSCLKDAYAFEFGSSRGSKDKDSTVAAMLSQQTLPSVAVGS